MTISYQLSHKNKNGKLFMLMGIPGSGKSFWASKHYEPSHEIIISRDEIRFNIVQENEEYFSHEKEVFKEFARQINLWLGHGVNIYADATHLTPASRNKLIRSIVVPPSDIQCIWMRTPLKIALKRNEERKGTRSYVPQTTIYDMSSRIIKPALNEGFSKIYIIEPNEPIKILEEM